MKKNKNISQKKVDEKKKKARENLSKRKDKKRNYGITDKQFFDDVYTAENFVEKKELELINKENFIVRKDNKVLQKASFDFERDELKVVNYSIAKIIANKNLTENDELEFSISDLLLVLGKSTGGKDYTRIKQTLDNIGDESRWVKIPQEDGEDELQFRFFMKVKISKKNIVKIRFMQEFLDAIKINKKIGKFTEETLIYSLMLDSKYAIRLYELSKSWQENILRYERDEKRKCDVPLFGFTLYIDKIKDSWCLPEKYTSGKIKTILDLAINDINKNTDIELEIKNVIKKDKKIIGYEIVIKPNYKLPEVCKKIAEKRKRLLGLEEDTYYKNV